MKIRITWMPVLKTQITVSTNKAASECAPGMGVHLWACLQAPTMFLPFSHVEVGWVLLRAA